MQAGKAQKVSIYVSEGAKHHQDAAAEILDFLFKSGVGGATVLKGVAGFGAEHRMHSASLLAIGDHLPEKVEFIESAERVKALMPRLIELAGSGMIEVQETMIVKPAGEAKKV